MCHSSTELAAKKWLWRSKGSKGLDTFTKKNPPGTAEYIKIKPHLRNCLVCKRTETVWVYWRKGQSFHPLQEYTTNLSQVGLWLVRILIWPRMAVLHFWYLVDCLCNSVGRWEDYGRLKAVRRIFAFHLSLQNVHQPGQSLVSHFHLDMGLTLLQFCFACSLQSKQCMVILNRHAEYTLALFTAPNPCSQQHPLSLHFTVLCLCSARSRCGGCRKQHLLRNNLIECSASSNSV